MRVTPTARAACDPLGRDRGVGVQVGVAVDHSGFGNSGAIFSTGCPPGCAPYRAPSSAVSGAPSAASSFSVDSGMYGTSSTVTTRRPSASDRSAVVQLVGLGRVLGQLPRRRLLDVAVQPPHAHPDPLQRLRDLRLVEQRRDLLDAAPRSRRRAPGRGRPSAPRRRSSARPCWSCGWRGCRSSLASSLV